MTHLTNGLDYMQTNPVEKKSTDVVIKKYCCRDLDAKGREGKITAYSRDKLHRFLQPCELECHHWRNRLTPMTS